MSLPIPNKTNNKTVVQETPADLGNPQVNWDRKKFDDFITSKGYQCEIERALKCPCANDPTGQALTDCRNCFGTGWFFIDKQKTQLACTSMSNRTKHEVWSQVNAGMVTITARAKDKLGFMDKVTLIELESWFSQTFKLKLSKSEPTKYFSFLIYKPIQVYDLYLFKNSDEPLVVIPESFYQIDGNKILINKSLIESLGILEPTISIRYTHNPCYHVIDVNRDLIKQDSLNDTNIETLNYPINCIGKRAHFMYESANYNGNVPFDNTDYQRQPIKYE